MLGAMTERTRLPRRAESPGDYLRESRIGAAVALALVAAAVTWDVLDGRFWSEHAIISGLVSSLLVVVVSAGVLNELFERRERQRWSVLAQYVLLDLTRTARVTWTGLLELAGLLERPDHPMRTPAGTSELVADRHRLRQSFSAVLADPQRRETLQRSVARMASESNDVLGRWAGIMLSATAYTEVIDRHVELYSRVAWLDGLLGYYEPLGDDPRRQRLSGANPAVEIQQDVDDDTLCGMIVSITVLAESLDRGTLDIAMRLVPYDWWQARVRDDAAAPSGG